MTQPRLSTVFDYSDLRLHPDGTRVYQKTSNRRPVLAKVTFQDPHANWIAKDAGGSARVAKYRKRTPKEAAGDGYAEEIDISRELDNEADEEKRRNEDPAMQSSGEGSDTSQLGKKRTAKRPPDQRKFKRRKFEANHEYLDDNEPRPRSVDSGDQSIANTFPTEPSPDLLKIIHRFASEFYTERGQLLNISREYRKERKKRALERKEMLLDGGPSRDSEKNAPFPRSQSLSSSSDSDNSDDHSERGAERREKLKGKGKERERNSKNHTLLTDRDEHELEDEDHGEGDEAYNDEIDEIESESEADSKKSPQRKRGEKILSSRYTDMYKVFDGSAMMALGMLVQEHISSLLNPEIPESWSIEAKKVYTDAVSSSDKEDSDEQLQLGEETTDDSEEEGDEEDEESEADEQDEGEMNKGVLKGAEEEEDETGEEDELLLDEEGEDDRQDEVGVDKEGIPEGLEHENENEHQFIPYLPASSRTQTQRTSIDVDPEPFISNERTMYRTRFQRR